MTSLICLVQRLSLGDSSRSLVKEGERFEVDEVTAEQYIKGGIAKIVPVAEPKAKPEPFAPKEPEKVVGPAPAQEPAQEDPPAPEEKTDKRRKKA